MNALAYEEIVDLHDSSIRDHGGAHGILNEGTIRAATAAPFAGYGDYEHYPSIVEKSAVLCFSLVQGHGFRDGNKRVGLLALVTSLAINGYLLEATNQEAQEFILALASGQKSKDELLVWVQNHVATAPLEPVAGELSYGGDLVLSQQAQQLRSEKPNYWEAKLFAQVLKDEIDKSSDLRIEYQQGISSRREVTFDDHYQFFRWMSSQCEMVSNEIGNQSEIINFLGNEISNSTRETQDGSTQEGEDLGLSLAVELGAIYRATLERCLHLKAIQMPEEYQPLLDAWAGYFDGYMENIETSPARYLDEITKAEFSDGEGTYRATIVIDMSAKDSEALSRELEELRIVLGLGNEDEPNALERINEALEVVTDLFANQARLVTDYSNRLGQNIANLEKVSGIPKHISVPRTKAIYASFIQRNRSLSRELKLTFSDFEASVRTCEIYSRLVGNLLDASENNFEEDAQSRISDLRSLQESIEECRSTIPLFRKSLEDQKVLLDGTASSYEELIATYNTYDLLLRRFVDSLEPQIESIESKLSV